MSDRELSKQEAMNLAKQAGVEEMGYFVIGYMSGRSLKSDFMQSTVVEYCKKISSLSATQSQKEELYLLLLDMNLGNLRDRMSKLRPASVMIDPLAGKESQNIGYNPGLQPSPIFPDIKKAESNSITTAQRYAYESRENTISQNRVNPEEIKHDKREHIEISPKLISTEGINGLMNPAPDTLQFVNKVAGNIIEAIRKEPKKDLNDNIIGRMQGLQRELDINKYEEKPKSPAYQGSQDMPSSIALKYNPENAKPQFNIVYNPNPQGSMQDIKLPQQADRYNKVESLPAQNVQEIRLIVTDQKPKEISMPNHAELQYTPQENFGSAYPQAYHDNHGQAKDQVYQNYMPNAELPAKRQSEHDLDQHYSASVKAPQEGQGYIIPKIQNEAIQLNVKEQDQPAKKLSEQTRVISHNEPQIPQEGYRLTYVPGKSSAEIYPVHNQGYQSIIHGQSPPYKIQPEQSPAIKYAEQPLIPQEKNKSYELEGRNPPYQNKGQGHYQGQVMYLNKEGYQSNGLQYNTSSTGLSYKQDTSDQMDFRGPTQAGIQDYHKLDQPIEYEYKGGQVEPTSKPDEKANYFRSSLETYNYPGNSPSDIKHQLDQSQFDSGGNFGQPSASYSNSIGAPSSINMTLPQQSPKQYPQQAPQQVHQQIPQQFPQQSPQQSPQQYPQQAPQQVHQQSPQQYPQHFSQQSPQEVPQQSPQQLPQQVHQQFPQQSPQQVPHQYPVQSPPQVPQQPPLLFRFQDIYSDQSYSSQSQAYPKYPDLSQYSSNQGAQPYALNPEMSYGQFTFNSQYQAPGAVSPYQKPNCCLCQNYSDTSVISVCRLNHTTHISCIVNMAVNDLNRNILPNKCPYPQCTAELETFNFYNNLPRNSAEKLDMLAAQQIYDLSGEVLVTTHCLRCRTLIEHDKSNTCLQCRSCGLSFCTKCNQESHPGRLCT